MDDEHPTIYHISQIKKAHPANPRQIIDDEGCVHRNPIGIVHAFANHFKRKYGPIVIHSQTMQRMIDAILPALPSTQIPPDEQTVMLEEIKQAIRKGDKNKAPGPDGIGTAFYKENWETVKDLCEVLNQMLHETTDTQQNQGINVCLPKPNGTQTPEGYRPITLLNTDYKILARIIPHRIRPVMEKLHESQYCGVPGNNILDAVTTIREAIA
jgi:hypothetical protein